MTEVSSIAERLTEAQAETIACAWSYPDFHRQGEQVSYCPIWRNESSRRALENRGLIASLATGGPRLTPLGLQVKAYLQDHAK
jgi:hypothetical protein